MGDDRGGGTDSPDVIFLCSIKSRRWRAVMEEVDKGCSEFYVTAGTVTRIAGILIQLVKGAGC